MRVAIAFVLLCSSTALAQSVETAAVPDGAHSPGFVTIERFDAVSRGGADFSYISPNGGGDVTLLDFNLHGQYITPSGLGGYAQLPIAYATGTTSSGMSDSITALGDLEGGLVYLTSLGHQKLALHAGLTLPTASDDLDKLFAGIFGIVGSRPTDYFQIIPKGTSVRLGASPLIRSGTVFARIDAGIDLNLDNSGDRTVDSFLHFNGGVGFDLGNAAIMGELTNIYSTADNGGWINVAALSARLKAGDISPYGALLIPLDDDSQQIIDLAFTAGLEAAIH